MSVAARPTLISTACGLLAMSMSALATPPTGLLAAGELYEIRQDYSTAESKADGGSSSSSGHSTIAVRVIAIRPDGVELEYDLPSSAKPDERLREWKFPARIFRPNEGTPRLLNEEALESRVDNWLKAGKMTRAACGRWIFTWNAFKIECDPASVLKSIAGFDIGWNTLGPGTLFSNPAALNPAPLVKSSTHSDGTTLTVVFPLNAEYVRQARAESDVVVGEILRKPVALEQALAKRSKEIISGTISVELRVDPTGRELKRVTTTSMRRQEADGQIVTETSTETLEKRRVSSVSQTLTPAPTSL